MAVININNYAIIEGDSGSQYIEFVVYADAAVTADTYFYYYTQDGTASSANGDFFQTNGTGFIPAGQTSATVRITIYGDQQIEGNEYFQLVVLAGQNASLTNDAPALIATGVIRDDDDAVPDTPGGVGGPAAEVAEPPLVSPTEPTVRVFGTSIIEGDSGSEYAYFLITLDRPATSDVTISYYMQDRSASEQLGDYFQSTGTVTIPAGQQSTWVRATVYGDNAIEGDEAFQLVIFDASNAVLEGEAPALVATATIIDDDGGPVSGPGGTGPVGIGLTAPDQDSGTVPTVNVRDVSVIEGSSGSTSARFLVSLDRPATSDVTIRYYTQDHTAWSEQDDFFSTAGTLVIPAGSQSGYVSVTVYGDNRIEGDEDFQLVIWDVDNAVMSDNAPALIATGTIVSDDGIPSGETGEIGDFGADLAPAQSEPGILPTLTAHDVAFVEGDSGSGTARVLVTLDRPALGPVTFTYIVQDGSASHGSGDYFQTSGTATIPAGAQSTYINVTVYGDTLIEGNETARVVILDVTNAELPGGSPAIEAEVQILDNDTGATDLIGGTGLQADPVAGPSTGPSVNVSVVGSATNEGGSSVYVYAYVLLSEPAATTVTMDFTTVAGTATAGTDFVAGSGTLTINAGDRVGYVQIRVYGDTLVEGDETFAVEFSNLSGAVFSNGQSTMTSTLTIRDNEAGTAGSSDDGPLFVGLLVPQVLVGDDSADVLLGGRSNDSLYGGAGDDVLTGGEGNDIIRGGAGADVMSGGAGFDTLSYADSTAAVQVFLGGNTAAGGHAAGDTISGFENVVGSNFDDRLFGSAQVNLLDGGAGSDILLGNNGNDTLRGRAGRDILYGGNDDDTFAYFSVADAGLLFADRDRIQDFSNGDDRIDLSAVDADTGTAGNQAFTYVGRFFSGTAGELRSYENVGLTFIEGDVDGDGSADFRIELLGTGLGIDGSDFVL
ncbi:MAG: hypothetical protein CMJ42_05615 [Phyllobacteriaceae bacterium]|nr:hypothetical protein [Phyllobacteriaceae bacterium]